MKLKLIGEGEFIEDMYKNLAKRERMKGILERKMQIEHARLAHKHEYLKKTRDIKNINNLFNSMSISLKTILHLSKLTSWNTVFLFLKYILNLFTTFTIIK